MSSRQQRTTKAHRQSPEHSLCDAPTSPTDPLLSRHPSPELSPSPPTLSFDISVKIWSLSMPRRLTIHAPEQQQGFRCSVADCPRKFRTTFGRTSPSRPRPRSEHGFMRIRSLAAHTTVTILAELGLPCAIFGSMACKIYGNQQIPNVCGLSILKVPKLNSF